MPMFYSQGGILLVVFGIILFFAGLGCTAAAMTSSTTATFWELYGRSIFQRRADYTESSWRLWVAGCWMGCAGFILVTIGLVIL